MKGTVELAMRCAQERSSCDMRSRTEQRGVVLDMHL